MSEFEAEKAATGKSPCDCGCGDCGGTAKSAAAQPDNSRRKLLFGGVIATPAIVMLSSRSALANGSVIAGQCTASAHASVNLSKPTASGCKSLSPGCWKNTLSWPAPFKPGLPDPVNGWATQFTVSDATLRAFFKDTAQCTSNSSKLSTMVANFRAANQVATMCTSYFSWAPTGKSFMQALNDGGGGNAALLRMAVACALNAAQFGAQAFGYTYAEIIALINQRFNANDPTLTTDLIYLTSDRGGSCPGPGSVNTFNWCSLLNA